MEYYLNLKTKTINDLKQKLTTQKLIPSLKILLEDIDVRFAMLEALGLETMFDIHEKLKTKPKVEKFSKETGQPFDYLIVLRREVYSYEPKPRKIQDFICISDEIKTKLMVDGIKTTLQLFYSVYDPSLRNQLKEELELNDGEVMVLAKLTDLCRLRYVNADFATLLLYSNYDTIDKIKTANHEELYKNITELNSGKVFYKGKIGLNDMGFLIADANFISSNIKI